MKTHYCLADKTTISYEGECNWCGEKENDMKEEALKLADDLEELHEQDLIDGVAHLSMPQASAMIRRLVEELDKLNGCLIAEQEHNEMLQTKPKDKE